MILTLLAVSHNDQALTRPVSAHFDANGGTIGRADHSTMALPDPERVISRKQAEVVFTGSGFMIRNTGAANPIQVAGRVVAQGETAALNDGDEVRVGGYLLRVRVSAGPSAQTEFEKLASPLRTAPRAVERITVPVGAEPPPLDSNNPFADLLGPAAPSTDPFADLLGPAPAAAAPARDAFAGMMAAPAGLGARSGAVAGAPSGPGARLPDDFDPFASPAASAAPASSAPFFETATPAADPLADFSLLAGGASIDVAFGLEPRSGGDDPLARFSADLGAAPASGGDSLSTDPLLLFGGAAQGPATLMPAQRDDLPALNAAYAPPRVQAPIPTLVLTPAPRAVPTPATPAAPAAARAYTDPGPAPTPTPAPAPMLAPRGPAADNAQALWQAFCDGAGVQVALPPGSGPERMRTIGRVLRSAVEGTLQLMAVRASTKHEMRAAVTQIQARSNNPLKFSPDAGIGVEQLVQPPTRGFLDGPAAMEDAMQDLVGHSIGTVTGMRAAIDGMLDRFDPAVLEQKLSGASVLDSLLPMNRRSRLWELYVQHHKSIRDEAQEDFHTLFGKAFLAAYEQQVSRLKNRGST